jgi:hypothetical protein
LIACGVSAADATAYINRASRSWLRIGLLQVDIKSFDDLVITSSFSVSQRGQHGPFRSPVNTSRSSCFSSLAMTTRRKKAAAIINDDLVPSIKTYLTQL